MDGMAEARRSRSKRIAAYAWTFNFLVRDDGSESLEGMSSPAIISASLGLQPLLGRRSRSPKRGNRRRRSSFIGYDLWQRKFNGDPHIVGKTIRMSRQETPPTVIGVMPPGVRFLPSPARAQEPNYNVNGTVDFWMPAAPNPRGLKQPTGMWSRGCAGVTARSGAGGAAVHRRAAGAGRPRLRRHHAARASR